MPKRNSPLPISDRRDSGRASVEKGRKFEDQVADLYRLLGAQVIQGIEICNKKVDIFATFKVPGSNTEHRVIVECKDENKAIDANQRVMQFHGLLDAARKADEADSAEIVTRVPWSEMAKGFAQRTGVNLLTYAEKISQLIDFTPYLKILVSRFKEGDSRRPTEPPLNDYYVDLSAISNIHYSQHIPIIDRYINRWLQNRNSEPQLAIFGEYGAGKTSLCQKLAHDLAATYLKDSSKARIPILFNLREFIGKVEIEAFVTSFLDRECKASNPKFDLFKAMNDAGIFLLIFDGLDEMAVKVDADTLESNLIEIDQLAASPNSRVILTSRPEYFINTEEERQAMNPKLNIFRTRAAEYEPLKILPWDEKQVERFLERRVPLVKEAKQHWTFYRDRIKDIPNLSDLSQRPVLLDMIVKTLPKLIEDNTPINLPNLYRTYLEEEIKRQKISKKRVFLLNEESRFALLQHLAVDIYSNTISSLTFVDALNRLEQKINPPRNELEAYTREFLTNSFLIRDGEEYRFSHKSILEFLVTEKLDREIKDKSPDAFGRCLISPVIIDFLLALKPDEPTSYIATLSNWINKTKGGLNEDNKYLGGNAARLLYTISKDSFDSEDFSQANLTGVDLSSADLRAVTFDKTILKDAKLTNTRFLRKTLKNANLSNTLLSFHLLIKIEKPVSSIPLVAYATRDIRVQLSRSPTLKSHLVRAFFRHPFKGETLVTIDLRLTGKNVISSVRDAISKELSIPIYVFDDECEQLITQNTNLITPESGLFMLPSLLN